MKTDNYIVLGEQLEKLATKCRIAGTENARTYAGCLAVEAYVKHLASKLPIKVRKKTNITQLWYDITSFRPELNIDLDDISTVERYLTDMSLVMNDSCDTKLVSTLLSKLSEISHND